MKRCTRCKCEKAESEFAEYKGKLFCWCRACQRESSSLYYHALSERKRKALNRRGHATAKSSGSEQRHRNRWKQKYQDDPVFRQRFQTAQAAKRYGITPEEYADRRSRPCAICGVFDAPGKRGSGMHIDHDHASGSIRGTLCAACNRGIGMFGDRAELLVRAAAYLREWEK